MTRDGEVTVLREHLRTCSRLESTLRKVQTRVVRLIPLSSADMQTMDEDDHIGVLAFLKTFEQFEDTLGRTLKVIAMLMHFGQDLRLTPRDVANRSLALGVLESAAGWADAVRVRNELAHEYPLNPGKQAAQVNDAWANCATLFDTRAAIEAFVAREGLLDGVL